ncbi:FMN-dependent NADH-azoreductase [Vibrio natriegens]
MQILLINSSPRQKESSTYFLAQAIIKFVSKTTSVSVTEEDVTTLPQVDLEFSKSVTETGHNYDESVGSLALSNQLISDLIDADLIIVTSPIHNFSLPSGLKSWVDHVVRAGKTFSINPAGKKGLLKDKPVYVLAASGGMILGENAYQSDFFTPYMKTILSTIGIDDVNFFIIEATASTNDTVEKNIDEICKKVLVNVEEYLTKDNF